MIKKFCDFCGTEMVIDDYSSGYQIRIFANQTTGQAVKIKNYSDICEDCANKVMNMENINDKNSKKNNKKKKEEIK